MNPFLKAINVACMEAMLDKGASEPKFKPMTEEEQKLLFDYLVFSLDTLRSAYVKSKEKNDKKGCEDIASFAAEKTKLLNYLTEGGARDAAFGMIMAEKELREAEKDKE